MRSFFSSSIDKLISDSAPGLWIRISIHFTSWIRIRIQYADLDPGGKIFQINFSPICHCFLQQLKSDSCLFGSHNLDNRYGSIQILFNQI